MENIQRLLGGGGGDGGGGEEEEESVVNIEEGGGELLEQSGPEIINNFPPEEPNSCQENGKRKTDSIGSRSRNMSDKTVTAVLKADKTKKTNSSYKEGNCEEYSSGKNVKEKSPKVREEKKKAEQTHAAEKRDIHKKNTGESTEDEDFVPQKKTRKLRESSEKVDVTPDPEKPGKRRTRKTEKDEGNNRTPPAVPPLTISSKKVGKRIPANAKSKERTPSGAKNQNSPVTPANNALKRGAKGENTPIGLLVTPSNLSSRGTPSTPATLEKKNKKGETGLQTAVIKGDETTVRQLLEAGACPNTRDYAGWTPLHEARCRPELVEMLLEAGALPSVPAGDDRMTALHEAAAAGQVEVVRLLVRHGADRDARDRMGRTPSQLAQGHERVLLVLKNEPHVAPPSGVRPLLGPPCVVLMKEDPCKLAVKLGFQEMREVGEATTHLVASQDQADQVQWLAAVIVGAEIVGESWLKEGEVGEESGHRLEAEGLEISRAWRAGLQPKLLAGIHIYFKGTFSSPTKAELQMLARLGGATVLNR